MKSPEALTWHLLILETLMRRCCFLYLYYYRLLAKNKASGSVKQSVTRDPKGCSAHADTGGDVGTPLRLVTLFRDKETYKEPENPKLATWKQDLDRRLLELEEAAAVRISSNFLSASAR